MAIAASAVSASTDPMPIPDLQGAPVAGLIQWGDRLRRQFESGPEEEEDEEQEQQGMQNGEDSKVRESKEPQTDAPALLLQSGSDAPAPARLNLHRNEDASKLPSAETRILTKEQ